MNEKENKNQQKTEEQQQEQTPKKESFLKRTWNRYKRDLLDVAIGVAAGGVVTYEVLKARSGKAAEETAAEDQETEEEEEDVLEVSDE